MSSLDYAAILVALMVAVFAPIPVRVILERARILDVPNGRSSHRRPVLRGGGLAPMLALVAAVPLVIVAGDRALVVVAITVATGAALLGFVDDVRSLPARARLILQLILGAVCGLAVAQLTEAPMWWAALVMIGVAAYINMVNFMDGADFISGLHGLVAGASLAVAGALTDTAFLTVGGALVAVVFAGFLPWNVLGARMFLGDVGSYLLGAALSALAVAAIASGVPPLAVLAPFSVYVVDTSVTVVRRVLRKENLLEAHRSHIYQELLIAGWTHLRVAVTVAVFTALAACVGLLSVSALSPEIALTGVIAINAAYVVVGMAAQRRVSQS